MSNALQVIYRIINNPVVEVKEYYTGKNRANSVGEALENYVKDLFADSIMVDNEVERLKKITEVFSYLGNQNNPPDIILKGGDAIEIKKVQGYNSTLALNSSYPKSKLYANSPMLTSACKTCEKWDIKDILYIVGCTTDVSLKYLWFAYGDCFAADSQVYEKIRNAISEGVKEIPDVEFSQTNELGKVKKVDPLGITDLRIRGMWHIQNPVKIFNYLNCNDSTAKFQLNVLMRIEKFNSFPDTDKNNLLNLSKDNYSITDVEFKNPDNPAQLLRGKLIIYKIK